MSALDEVTKICEDEYKGSANKQELNFGGVLSWAEIILNLLKNCNIDADGVKDKASNAGLLTTIAVRRAVKRSQPERISHSAVVKQADVILRVGRTLSEETVSELLTEISEIE